MTHLDQGRIERISLRTRPGSAELLKIGVLGRFTQLCFQQSKGGLIQAYSFAMAGFKNRPIVLRWEWTSYFLAAVKVPLAIPARSTLPFMVCPAASSFPV